VRDGTSLWADKFDETVTNIFALQDSSQERVAAGVFELERRGEGPTSRHYTENTEAYQFYLKAATFGSKRTEEGFRRASIILIRLSETIPNYALAYTRNGRLLCVAQRFRVYGT